MKEKIKILIGCEESQAVTIAFRERGFEAYSCDLLDCSGGYPEWHLKMDVKQAILLKRWDMIGLHNPCTYTALCGNRHYYNSPLRVEGVEFTKSTWELACSLCDSVYLEQPKTIMQQYIGKRYQTIHPWQFGHGETKETWLWLKGLPKLTWEIADNLFYKKTAGDKREQRIHKLSALNGPGSSKDRKKNRSKTYTGIAQAMAEQWGNYLLEQKKVA